ncbi:MAG: hypothetical protein AB1435_09170 [Chloroflexota bacterium]|jgi:hypothetical protein
MKRGRNILLGLLVVVVVIIIAVVLYILLTDDDEEEALPTVGALTLGPEEAIRLEEGVYWVDDPEGEFTITVEATNAARAEFFARDAGGNVLSLGVDEDGADGWSITASLDSDYSGSVYAQVYPEDGEHVTSEELPVAR